MQSVTSRHILLSNDDPVLLWIYKTILHDAAFERVYSSRTAVGTIRLAQKLVPDLIITDMIKYGDKFNGEQMAWKIKSRSYLANVPIVLLSGIPTNAPTKSRVFRAFVPLPVTAAQFLLLVRLALGECLPLILHRERDHERNDCRAGTWPLRRRRI